MACITEQDYKIAERIEQEGKGCVIVVNKWDTIPNKNQQTATYYEQDVREKLRILDWAPIVYSTAIAGHSIDKIIDAASEVEKERSRRLGTSILNQVVLEAVAFKPPPRTRAGKRGRVYYCTQEMLDYNIKFAPIGLTNMLNNGGVIQEVEYVEGVAMLKVKGDGQFSAYSSEPPKKFQVNGSDVDFEWLPNGKLMVNLSWIQEDHDTLIILHTGTSQYQHIALLDTKPFGKALVIDGKFQSAETDEFIYHECLVHPTLLHHPK
ncbi:hypothetical protein HN51_038017 [Arachis hypogaea]